MDDILGRVVSPLFLGFLAAGLIGNAIIFIPWTIVVFIFDRRSEKPRWGNLIGPGLVASQVLATLICLYVAYQQESLVWVGASLPFSLGAILFFTGKGGVRRWTNLGDKD